MMTMLPAQAPANYPQLVSAIKDIAENPVDSRGYARQVLLEIASADIRYIQPATLNLVMRAIVDDAQKIADEILRRGAIADIAAQCGGVRICARAGGDGTVGGLTGNVTLLVSPVGRPVYLA